MNPTDTEGLAFIATPDGTICEIVAGTLSGAILRASLPASVDATSREACAVFLESVARGGFARSTPLRIGTRDVHCFGYRNDDRLNIVSVVDPLTAAPFAETLPGDFASLAREIRRTHSTYELYEELARLNNELVTAQRELARTVAELRRLNDWKDELLGMAAHDLRNPLNANAAFITFLLADAGAMPEDARVLLDRLKSNSEYMLRLVENVLDFSAINSGRVRLDLRETDLGEVVRNVLETARIIAEGKRVEIRSTIEGDVPPLQLDPIKIAQAVQNLVSNAVQYSAHGSTVDVRVRAERGHLIIEVEDRGTAVRESRRRRSRGCSSRSGAGPPPSWPRSAAWAWAWRSRGGWWRRTAARSA